ncbi:MAG: hypothetical protein AB7S26_11975 [Sandaracinaceae bacterium]
MRAAVTLCLALVSIGCGPPAHVRELASVGLRAQEIGSGWYRFISEDGYRFRMPGIPRCQRETFHYARRVIPATFCDLRAERNSRGYLFRAFDAAEMDWREREDLRLQAEDQIVRVGDEVSDVREVRHREVTAFERVVSPVSDNGHIGIVRTLVYGPHVFQLVIIVSLGSGDPQDARTFFDSVQRSPDRAPTG